MSITRGFFYYADLTSHHLFWLKKSLAELQVCHSGLGSDGKSKLINFQLQSPVWQTLFWEEVRKSCSTISLRGSLFTELTIKNMKERKLKGLYDINLTRSVNFKFHANYSSVQDEDLTPNSSINCDERTRLLMHALLMYRTSESVASERPTREITSQVSLNVWREFMFLQQLEDQLNI